MQKLINYTDFFQFFLHIPVAVFEEISDEQILEDCLEMAAYPIVIIKDSKHPLFIRLAEDFKKKGVTQELKSIILAIGYNTPYLS
jgi:hypothetical protein